MSPPDDNDRIITHLPKCRSPEAALQTKEAFHPRVRAACQTLEEDAVGFNFAKVIVVGDVSVGKTCLVSRFSGGGFRNAHKATVGVDFATERFQVLGVPFGLQLWDTAGQERFKCIASTYYRGAQAIMVVFDMSRESSLAHARQWLEDAMKENDPSGVLLFLVGTKKDLSPPERLAQVHREAVRVSEEIRAEYWAVSAKSGAAYFWLKPPTPPPRPDQSASLLSRATGDGVRDLFLRVAALTFEANVLRQLEKSAARNAAADVIKLTSGPAHERQPAERKPDCC